eukprot:SAG31_NODE_173_length_21354_cov_16.826112_10_plen_202_part_00
MDAFRLWLCDCVTVELTADGQALPSNWGAAKVGTDYCKQKAVHNLGHFVDLAEYWWRRAALEIGHFSCQGNEHKNKTVKDLALKHNNHRFKDETDDFGMLKDHILALWLYMLMDEELLLPPLEREKALPTCRVCRGRHRSNNTRKCAAHPNYRPWVFVDANEDENGVEEAMLMESVEAAHASTAAAGATRARIARRNENLN